MSRTKASLAAVAFLLSMLPGCATGFNRQRMQEQLQMGAYEITVHHQSGQVSAADIARARQQQGQLKFPIRLAVDLRAPEGAGRWSVKDKETIASWGQVLRTRGVVSDIFVMSDLVGRGDQLAEIRLAAAKHGADAVLVVRSICDYDSYPNVLSPLYLTIIGAFIVPGSQVDALCILNGAVLDVGNEFLYASIEAEGEGATWGTYVGVKPEDAITEARRKALADFGKEAVERLTGLK